MLHTWKCEEFGQELAEPRGILWKMDRPGMELSGLSRNSHDLITIEFHVVMRRPYTLVFERLDQTGAGALVLDDEVRKSDRLPLFKQSFGRKDEFGKFKTITN